MQPQVRPLCITNESEARARTHAYAAIVLLAVIPADLPVLAGGFGVRDRVVCSSCRHNDVSGAVRHLLDKKKELQYHFNTTRGGRVCTHTFNSTHEFDRLLPLDSPKHHLFTG